MSVGSWSFNPLLPAFPATVLPNIAYWNVSNGTWEYQVHVSWPLNWTSTSAQSTVDTLYVIDGNAQAHTATEGFRKRRPVDFNQPDTIIVSIGYPNTQPDSPYSDGRYYDYQMPVCANCTAPEQPGVPSNGDNFLAFIDQDLRPWVHSLFPNVQFDRDGLFGHSFGGLFVIYTLLTQPELFDVYLSASPFLVWNNEYIFTQLDALKTAPVGNNSTQPALQISYGALEQFAKKRRTETQAEFETRRDFLATMKMTELCERLYNEIKDSPKLRDVELNVYPNSYHAAVASAAICDGIDYFLDW